MANEMFTTRSGKQVEVPDFVIPASEMTSILRLKEDFEARGEHLSLLGVVIHVIEKGIGTTRNYWKNSENQKGNRDLGKVIKFMLSRGATMNSIAEFLEQKTGKRIALDAPAPPEAELTEAELNELEKATSPNGAK